MRPQLRLLRPKQWIKNGFVIAPIFFAHQMNMPASWFHVIVAAIGFICISSMAYIFNDICDVKEDQKHPVKKRRPIASGEITVLHAAFLGCICAAITLFILSTLRYQCSIIAVIYIGINLSYTFYLKRIAIIDIFMISSCYVLRVLMGCYAINVTVSPWIILTTFLLALFLGFGKRYHEMGFEDYAKYKQNLQDYNRNLLDKLVNITGGAALITYAIYTTEIARQVGKVDIVYTVAFVAFGLFRYLQTIYVFNEGGEPENIVLKDKFQLANFVLWLVVTLWLMS
jgi:4-hydroxybenzoate polyprenyltransferase